MAKRISLSRHGWRRFLPLLMLCLALGAGASLGQETAADLPLQGPTILATAVADVYAPSLGVAVGPRDYPSDINSLTGLPYPDEESRARRNLIIKVSNWPPRVRPQHAISQADLVYEYEAEGGVTRFAAIYRSQSPPQVGSIRSARLLDIELLTMYAALLAYSGTSGPLHEIYKNADFRPVLLSPSLSENCETAGFCRDDSLIARGYEHTLFGNTQKMWERASLLNVNIGYRALGFAFALQPPAGGAPIVDIYINWYNRTDVRWQYDSRSGAYLRYTDGGAHRDAIDDSQLTADNLIFIQVAHNQRPDLFQPGAFDESFEVALWGQGPAYVLRDGQLYQGYWQRRSQSRGEALALIHPSGENISLKPGRSWVTVMRNLEALRFSASRAAMAAPAAG